MQLNVTNLYNSLKARMKVLVRSAACPGPTSSKDLNASAGPAPGIYQVPFIKDYEDTGLFKGNILEGGLEAAVCPSPAYC